MAIKQMELGAVETAATFKQFQAADAALMDLVRKVVNNIVHNRSSVNSMERARVSARFSTL